MKKNFTEQEFNSIKKVFGNVFNVRFNKAGNITLEWKVPCPHTTYNFPFNRGTKAQKFFTFYRPSFKNGEILIRALSKYENGNYGYCYPLNMRNRKTIESRYGSYLSFDINDCYFRSVNEAIIYFEEYILTYQVHNIKKQLAA